MDNALDLFFGSVTGNPEDFLYFFFAVPVVYSIYLILLKFF